MSECYSIVSVFLLSGSVTGFAPDKEIDVKYMYRRSGPSDAKVYFPSGASIGASCNLHLLPTRSGDSYFPDVVTLALSGAQLDFDVRGGHSVITVLFQLSSVGGVSPLEVSNVRSLPRVPIGMFEFPPVAHPSAFPRPWGTRLFLCDFLNLGVLFSFRFVLSSLRFSNGI